MKSLTDETKAEVAKLSADARAEIAILIADVRSNVGLRMAVTFFIGASIGLLLGHLFL